jgi:acyl-coenzyme A thioesterase PaaI-like protein
VDAAALTSFLEQIPYTRDLGLVIDHVGDDEVRMTLPDQPATRNLAGSVHAGALFAFGETVAGVAAGMRTFERAFPFARRAEIRYRRPGQGALFGRARVAADEIARVLEELEREGRSQLAVSVVLEDEGGQTVAELTIEYALRPRPDPS